MNGATLGLYVGATVLASLLANAALLYLLRHLAILDVPNARSLHARPVPRGGGLAMVLVFSVCLALLPLPETWRWPWLLTGLAFGLLGAWDDWRPRRPAVRFVLQVLLAGAFLAAARTVPPTAPAVAALVIGLAVLALVWTVNLFNFMDGADGFAATQALLFMLAIGALYARADAPTLALAALLLAATVAGFLCFNWHPARMFMGDAGSYFLGFQLVAVTWLAWQRDISLAVPLLLAAPFIVDASLTLGARIVRGERWWDAHRTHVYQRLALAGWTPARLVRALVVLNVGLCWPLAWAAQAGVAAAWAAAGCGYGLLAFIWYHARRRYPVSET